MTDTSPAEDITDGAQKAYASDAVVKALIGKDATPAALTETRPDCCGSGYGGFPDSSTICYRCGGAGGIAADPIDSQSAEIERLGREKYDLTIELEAAKEIIRRLEARWQVAQADYRAVMQAIGCESIAEVPDKLQAAESERDEARAEVQRLRNALKMIAGDNWSSFHVDSKGAHVADQIVTEMRRIASEALSAPAKEAGHAE